MKQVILYTKPGCKLCDPVAQTIEQVRQKFPFTFIKTNILLDPANHEKYKHDIPVVTVDGHEIARYHLTPSQLETALLSPS